MMKIAIVLSLLALYASGAFARFDYYSVTHSDPPAKCQYEIVVKTASIDNAGTDAQITVALSGADGSNKRLEVTDLQSWGRMGENYNYFESGNLDLFGGSGECVPSGPCRMMLVSDNSGNKPGWYVSYVKVTQIAPDLSVFSHTFKVDQWLAVDEPPYQLYALRDDCDAKHAVAME